MRKSVAIFILLAAVFSALAWSIWPRQEPRYQNWPASKWVDFPGYDSFYFGYFPKADSNAVPYLVAGLTRHNSPFDRIYKPIYTYSTPWLRKHLRLRPPRDFNDSLVRASAAQVLGRIGANSPAAISGLVRVLRHESKPLVKVNALESLQNIGKDNNAAKQAVIRALNDSAPEVRDAAEDALRHLDPAAAKSLIKRPAYNPPRVNRKS